MPAQTETSPAGPMLPPHTFETTISNHRICYSVTNLGRTLYIWIGSSNAAMNDLTLASITPYDSANGLPTTTSILGASMDRNSSEALTAKLAKRLGKPVLLSLNVNLPMPYLVEVEKRLAEEIKAKPDVFS
jgi:hypothetical protein